MSKFDENLAVLEAIRMTAKFSKENGLHFVGTFMVHNGENIDVLQVDSDFVDDIKGF